MATATSKLADEQLVDGALRVVARHGWAGASMERIAEECGVARVTLHRHGITRERVFRLFAARYERAFRDALWPVLTAPGDGRSRLARALEALCDLEEEHLDLLGVIDEDANARLFHDGGAEARTRSLFTDPLARLIDEGVRDGSIRDLDPDESATVLMNLVGRTYRHLRVQHGWGVERARRTVLDLVEAGYAS